MSAEVCFDFFLIYTHPHGEKPQCPFPAATVFIGISHSAVE